MAENFDLEAVKRLIITHNFKRVALQFPDELLNICVPVYQHLSVGLEETAPESDIELFISADSTFGSSVDDVSALHVSGDVIVYFGTTITTVI